MASVTEVISGTCHHLRDQTHAFAMVVARKVRRDNLVESFPASLAHVPGQMARRGIAIILAAGRIGSMVINLCQFDRLRVDPGRVPAAMLDEHGMVGNGSIQLVTSQRPTFDCLRIVVLEAQHPFAGSHF